MRSTSWLWELWNEPDIFYWRGTPEQFNELYTVTASEPSAVCCPTRKVGGPTVTSGGLEFLQGLPGVHVLARTSRWTSSPFTPRAAGSRPGDYGPIGARPPEQLNPSSTKMLFDMPEFNRAIAEFEQYHDLPAIVDECDAAVPAHFGATTTRNYEFQNTEYYPVFQVKLMKKILDLNATEIVSVDQATSWSFYFEGERYFEGTRSFLTAGGIEKPLLNGYRMLSHARRPTDRGDLDGRRGRSSDLDDTDGSSMPEEVDSLASADEDGTIAVLVWRHTDDQYQTDEAETAGRMSP